MNFLAVDAATRSSTSVCLTVADLDTAGVKRMAALLEAENVALDIGAYRSAPPGFRIWCGPTVEEADLRALLPWLEWAHERVLEEAREGVQLRRAKEYDGAD